MLQTFSGTIEKIQDINVAQGSFKQITLYGTEKQISFINFKNDMVQILNKYNLKDNVIISAVMKGSTSKSNINYNNINAKSIIKTP